ncbi:Other 1 protein kinase [Mycena venus]|uniref:Other 1 protein kinase n=1 Tax=Mycena venus TaxID=2733690 RepID=A0A8H6TZD2_9AGAR|nr:Other 1 protein kinase [Mycena venus]
MTTPPSAPAPILNSTPQSQGSGSHRNYAAEHTQKDYAPYLQEDLTHERTITVTQFFEWILHITNSQDTTRTENDSKFQKYLARYNRWDVYKHETELYQPFVELANYCIGRQTKVQFCRNDPTIVLGSDAERKPDVVSIWEATLALGARTSADNLSDGGPGKLNAFHWMELIAFWEFKFVPGGVDSVTLASSRSTQAASAPTAPQPPKKAAKKPPLPHSSRELRPRADTPAGPPTTTRSSEKRASNSAKANPEKEEDPRTQCASYALELLTYGGLRNHVIGALVKNNLIELLYYDRSIIVKSESFNFAQDTVRFITMLKGVADLTENQWGYHSLLNAPHPTELYPSQGVLTHPFGGSDIKLNNGRSLTMGETIFQSHGIIGRGTCVSRAKMEVNGTEKDPPNWGSNLAISGFSTTSPKILHAEQKEFDEDSPQRRLSEHFGEVYELRVLRIVVQERLRPITELTTAAKLSEAFHGIFKCTPAFWISDFFFLILIPTGYRWLHEKAGIVHRDISRNNLMYREIDGKVYGVLNDFDLSVFRDKEPRSTSKQRTGTEPYMAMDLLVIGPPPPHLYRFDLESLFYVIAYVVCQYHEGKKIDNPPFEVWDYLPTTGLRAKKTQFLADPIPNPTSNFLSFNNLNIALRRMFRTGYNARADAKEEDLPFDDTTLGGNINFDKFEAILETNLPSLT